MKHFYKLIIGILTLSFSFSNIAYARIVFVDDVFENNSEIFQIGANDDATVTNLSLEFGGTNSESLLWNTSAFILSDDINVSGSGTFTVANTQNQVGVTINQNDITNNPAAISIANTGTGNDITATNWNIAKSGLITSAGITSTGGIDFSGASAINIPFTDVATLTLDNDNVGVGANVDIIANQGADLDGTLRYNATLNQWELSNNGGPFDPITTGLRQTASAVQVRQAGAFSLSSTTFIDITFDTTDIETNATALQHNVTTTSRIDVKETGLYLISYSLNLDEATATGTWNSQVLLNGLTPINGSVQSNSNYQGEYVGSNSTFYANLTANDYITLQAQLVSANAVAKVSDPTLTIVKMEGIKGPKGDQGLPGSVGLGTNETTFTLDQDNVGTGVNVDLVANQGTGLDGTLRFNATTNRWQVSGDGGTTFNDIRLASVFDAYDNLGAAAVTTTQTTLNLDTTRVSDPAYTLATNVVTFNEAGLYRLTGRLSTTTLDVTGVTRSQMQLRFQQKIGAGVMTNVPGAYCIDYIREQANTNNAGGSCSIEWIGSFSAGDQVQLTHQMSGTTTGQTLPQGSGLMIEKIR